VVFTVLKITCDYSECVSNLVRSTIVNLVFVVSFVKVEGAKSCVLNRMGIHDIFSRLISVWFLLTRSLKFFQ